MVTPQMMNYTEQIVQPIPRTGDRLRRNVAIVYAALYDAVNSNPPLLRRRRPVGHIVVEECF